MTKKIEFEKIVTMSGAWDKRSDDPRKNYGIHGMSLRFVLRGPLGAIQFVIFTNWHLLEVQKFLRERVAESPKSTCIIEPLPADVGFHSSVPIRGAGEQQDCDVLPGGKCYYDGSGLRAQEWFENGFLAGGTDWLWPEMEKEYHDVFDEVRVEIEP